MERYANNVHELIFAAARLKFTGAPPEGGELKRFRILPPFASKAITVPGEFKVPLYYKGKDGPVIGPVGERVNTWLRVGTWVAFAAFWLVLAWRMRDFRDFLVASLLTLLGVYWLVATWIWPW